MKLQTKSFNFLTRCLSLKKDRETIESLRSEILHGDIPWQEVIDLANQYLLTPALWVSLAEKQLIDDLPEELHDYLKELYRLNKQRNEALKTQAIEAINALQFTNIEPVLLKGSAYLFLNSFGDPGARIMYDLDILVPANQLNQSVDVLHGLGYKTNPEDEVELSDHHHWPPLFRPGDFGAIELHHELLSDKASFVLTSNEAWSRIESFKIDGITVKTLSPTHRVLHSILHAQISDRYHVRHIINLRSLHDLACIVEKDGDKIDWTYIKKKMKQQGLTQVLRSHIYHANILLGLAWPDEISQNIFCRYHYLRAMAHFRWARVERLERDIDRFSRHEILRRYKCEDRWLPLTKIRLKLGVTILICRTISFFKWLFSFIKISKKC